MARRRNILSVVTAAAIGSAGCLSGLQAGSLSGGELEVGERTQAEGSRKELVKSEFDPAFEYVAENDTVRYPAKRSGGDVVEYGYTPFESWAASRAARAAIVASGNVYSPSIFDRNNLRVGPGGETDPGFVRVRYIELVNEDGEVVEAPDVELEAVIEDIPEAVAVTIEYGGQSTEFTVPCYVYREQGKHVWGTTTPE